MMAALRVLALRALAFGSAQRLCSGAPVGSWASQAADVVEAGATDGLVSASAFPGSPASRDQLLLALSHGLTRQQPVQREEGFQVLALAAAPAGSLGEEVGKPGLQHVLGAVQALAARVTNGTAQVDEATAEMLRSIHGEMESILNSTAKDHQQSQLMVDQARDRVQACDEHVAFTLNAAAKEREHDGCRETEVKLHRSRASACGEHDEDLQEPGVPDCVSNLGRANGATYETTTACLEHIAAWLGPYNASLRTSKRDCDAASTAHDDQVRHCISTQAAFETNFCDQYQGAADACSRYSQCRTSQIAEQKVVHDEVNITESGRKAAAVSAARIQCYLELLLAEHAQRPAMLADCSSLTPSTSHLDVAYHLTPEAKPCNASAALPCDRGWLAERYELKAWYADAQMADCMPCEAPGPAARQAFDTRGSGWLLYRTRDGAGQVTEAWRALYEGDWSIEGWYRISPEALGKIPGNVNIFSTYGANHNSNTYSSSTRRRSVGVHLHSDGKVSMWTGTGVSAFTATSRSYGDDQWHHVAAAWSRSAQRAQLWIDGENIGAFAYTPGSENPGLDGQLVIGGGHLSRTAPCEVAQVRLWNRALSGENVAEHADQATCVAGDAPGLVASYLVDGLGNSAGSTHPDLEQVNGGAVVDSDTCFGCC